MTPAPTPRRVVIAGGSGFLGRNLARHLCASGDTEVVLLSRNAPAESGPWRHQPWDGRSLAGWTSVLDGADALVNLAGRTVDCIKSPDHRDEILRSRVESTRVLGRAMQQIERPPAVWVQMSTAHIYGDPPSAVCDESAAFGTGLAPEVALAWEREFERGRPEGVRGVVLRTSFVLGRSGGALRRLVLLARLGLGGALGHGRQGISWIHEEDMDRVIERTLSDPSMQGAYIVTAPEPVSNAEFMRALRKAVGMPIGLPAAGWMVRIGAPLFLRTDPELALYGRYCVPARLQSESFSFRYPRVDEALRSLLSTEGRSSGEPGSTPLE